MARSEFSIRPTRRELILVEKPWTQSPPNKPTVAELRASRLQEIANAKTSTADPHRIRGRHRAEEPPRKTAAFGIEHRGRTR